MNQLIESIEKYDRIAILGHIRPDGDCIGSTLALFNYINRNYPDKTARVFLQEADAKFGLLTGFDRIVHECPGDDEVYELVICLDASDPARLDYFTPVYQRAELTVNVDHHITNPNYTDIRFLEAGASSTCEVLFGLLDPDKIDADIASCLYLGIVHDSGLFCYSCTSPETLRIAAFLMEKGVDFVRIDSETFLVKSALARKLEALAFSKAEMYFGGRVIFSYITEEEMASYHAKSKDLDAIVSEMRETEGVECSIFLYPLNAGGYKGSLRSQYFINVSEIAQSFGGGGHVRAAGFNVTGSIGETRDKILARIGEQFDRCDHT